MYANLDSEQHASEAFDYFKKAEKMILTETSKETKRRQQLLAITYNNLAIYYKKYPSPHPEPTSPRQPSLISRKPLS